MTDFELPGTRGDQFTTLRDEFRSRGFNNPDGINQIVNVVLDSKWLDEFATQVRTDAIAEFVLEQSVQGGKHSGLAHDEDVRLAITRFGVPPEKIYDPEDVEGAVLALGL